MILAFLRISIVPRGHARVKALEGCAEFKAQFQGKGFEKNFLWLWKQQVFNPPQVHLMAFYQYRSSIPLHPSPFQEQRPTTTPVKMHFLSFTALAVIATAPILAQDVDNNDIPTQCATVCSNLATVFNDCNRAFNDDRDERNCVCQAANAEAVIPLCAACVSSVSNSNDDDDDDGSDDDGKFNPLRYPTQPLTIRCRCERSRPGLLLLGSTTYDPATTYSQAAMTAATSFSPMDSAGSTTLTGTTTSAAVASATSAVSSAASAATNAVNAAPRPTAGVEGVGALAGAGLLLAAAWV